MQLTCGSSYRTESMLTEQSAKQSLTLKSPTKKLNFKGATWKNFGPHVKSGFLF